LIETLQTLCQVRLATEREAEQRLAGAAALHGREREREAQLAAELDAARERRDQARRDSGTAPASAAVIQIAHRYAARLDAQLRALGSALEAHVRGPLAGAAAALDRARADHLRARQRREAVERAIARREAARRRDQDRRAEIAADDLAQRRR
jgi:flagellar biosynthesis chaperone FliJ